MQEHWVQSPAQKPAHTYMYTHICHHEEMADQIDASKDQSRADA
jgi:hypothetical protein